MSFVLLSFLELEYDGYRYYAHGLKHIWIAYKFNRFTFELKKLQEILNEVSRRSFSFGKNPSRIKYISPVTNLLKLLFPEIGH